MKKYIIFFEIFNKKMKTTVVARSREEAELIIKNKIIFHSIREQPNSYSQKEDFILKNIMDIFNI